MLYPRRTARSRMRNAVVRFSDSYGGSMSAMVNVLSDMLRLLVPESLVTGHEVVHHHVDGSRGDSLGQLGDAALLQREVISKHRHAAPCQRAERSRVRRRARREHAVLGEEQRHLVIALDQALGQFVIVADIVRFKRVARLDEQVFSHFMVPPPLRCATLTQGTKSVTSIDSVLLESIDRRRCLVDAWSNTSINSDLPGTIPVNVLACGRIVAEPTG